MAVHIHPTALVNSKKIGDDTRIWAFVNILEQAEIGNACNICDHCFIENDVTIGNGVTIKTNVSIWDGVHIADDVFVGPAVVFSNDLHPRSKNYKPVVETHLLQGCSIGAGSILLAGIRIGKYAMTGIGSVVTRDVPDYALVYGNPARQHGWVDESGEKLTADGTGLWSSPSGVKFRETTNGLERV
jgi:acetyltransferase-like isoleucine patch superfamily enzyme